MKNNVRKLVNALTLCLMVVLAAAALQPAKAYAATKEVKVLSYSAKQKTIKKKATKIKKGTTTLHGTQGWFKFTSKKTKKYTFTFGSVSAPASQYNNAYGHITAQFPYRKYFRSKQMSTQGGKAYSLYLTTQTNYDKSSQTAVSYTTSLPSRSTKFKVKKGETVYFYFYFAGGPVFFNAQIN